MRNAARMRAISLSFRASNLMISIRPEEPRDHEAVHTINLAAFEGGPEADLVDALRLSCPNCLSLVAEEGGRVVGHILFTPVVIVSAERRIEGLGLAPMAVLPDRQQSGIGTLLVNHGLEVLQKHFCPFVVLVFDPAVLPDGVSIARYQDEFDAAM